ncbi:MAG: ROK family protein [Gemmatimonadota bacterium]
MSEPPPRPSAPHALAVDLGGTNLSCAVVDRQGRILADLHRSSLADRSADEILANLADALRQVLAVSGVPPASLAGIGVGAPGIVHPEEGVVHRAANFPAFRDLPLARLVGEGFGLPVRLHHDVDMALLAEQRLGAGRGRRHLLCLTVGTGIGLALFLNGRLYVGSRAGAGNLGHLILDPDADPGECNVRGYLEHRASGPAVRAAAIEAVRQGRLTSLREDCGDDPERIDARMVFAAARAGDAVCAAIVGRAAHLLGVAIANLANLLDPEVVIVGGGVAQANDALFAPLVETARTYVCAFLRDRLTIVPAQLGEDAGLIGAGLAVWGHEDD